MNKVTMIPHHVTYNGDICNPRLDLWFVKALGREMKNFVLRWWENNVSDLEDIRKSYKV